jgi:multiple sugar transport system permease protein
MTVARQQPATGARPAARLSAKRREAIAGYLFLLPDAAGLLVFIGLPMLLAFVISTFDVDGFGNFRFAGAANYMRMWKDPLFWQSFRVTVLFAVMLVPALYVTGLGLALLVQRNGRFNSIVRAMFFAPQMVSLVVVALVWQLMVVDKLGILTRILGFFGITGLSLLGDPSLALFTVTAAATWFLMGFYMLIFLGGLQDIPREYYEASIIDGAGPVQNFWYITLPLLRPTSFFVLLVSVVTAVAGAQVFDLVYVMTKGGPANSTSLLINYIYQQAFQYSAFGYAAAMATLLVVILMAVTVVLFLLTRGGRFQYD